MPEMETDVFVMENAGPDEELRLQSKMALPPFEPIMLKNGTLPSMTTVDSLKYPERYSVLARRD